jgi:hypothetical protein
MDMGCGPAGSGDLDDHLAQTERLVAALDLACQRAAEEIGPLGDGLPELAGLIFDRVQEARAMLDAATSTPGEGEPGRVASASASG